jgi:hypothetical protein
MKAHYSPHAYFPATEGGLEFIMEQIAALPTRREFARMAFVLLFVGAVLGIVGIEAFWRYAPAASEAFHHRLMLERRRVGNPTPRTVSMAWLWGTKRSSPPRTLGRPIDIGNRSSPAPSETT